MDQPDTSPEWSQFSETEQRRYVLDAILSGEAPTALMERLGLASAEFYAIVCSEEYLAEEKEALGRMANYALRHIRITQVAHIVSLGRGGTGDIKLLQGIAGIYGPLKETPADEPEPDDAAVKIAVSTVKRLGWKTSSATIN